MEMIVSYATKPEFLTIEEIDLVLSLAEKVATFSLNKMEPMTTPKETYRYLLNIYRDHDREVFGIIYLNAQHQVLCVQELFEGTIDAASVWPREVVKSVLEKKACAVLFFHNHPSHCTVAYNADIALTKRLVDCLKMIDVRVLDHIILGKDSFSSFAEKGLI